jgi:hypothetical protein
MKKLSSEDRATLIRLASSLPKGSPEKKAILAGLAKTKTAGGGLRIPRDLEQALGHHKDAFLEYLEDEGADYISSLSEKGRVTPARTTGSYNVTLPGGEALSEFGSMYPEEWEEVAASWVGAQLRIDPDIIAEASEDAWTNGPRGMFIDTTLL